MKKSLVIIPAFNEEKNLHRVVEEIKNYDYIIVNDGSTDNTKDLPYPMINLTFNHGVGYAMKKGYQYAFENNYDYAIQIDGDGQHNPEYIDKLLDTMIILGADMVIGKRNFNDYKCQCVRKAGINIIKKHLKKYQDITDPTSGMRLCNRKLIEEFSKNYPRYASEPLSLYNILRAGYRVEEAEVKMRERMDGKSFVTIKSAWKYMQEFKKGVKE